MGHLPLDNGDEMFYAGYYELLNTLSVLSAALLTLSWPGIPLIAVRGSVIKARLQAFSEVGWPRHILAEP